MNNKRIKVIWVDDYEEDFIIKEDGFIQDPTGTSEHKHFRIGSDLLWMRLKSCKNRHIPLRNVRYVLELYSSEPLDTDTLNKVVTCRWFDGYLKRFECADFSFSTDNLIVHTKTAIVTIPLRFVRWWSTDPESHESSGCQGSDMDAKDIISHVSNNNDLPAGGSGCNGNCIVCNCCVDEEE